MSQVTVARILKAVKKLDMCENGHSAMFVLHVDGTGVFEVQDGRGYWNTCRKRFDNIDEIGPIIDSVLPAETWLTEGAI